MKRHEKITIKNNKIVWKNYKERKVSWFLAGNVEAQKDHLKGEKL
jgi:hypothetical protein